MHLDFKAAYHIELNGTEFRTVWLALSGKLVSDDDLRAASELAEKLDTQRRKRAADWLGKLQDPKGPVKEANDE